MYTILILKLVLEDGEIRKRKNKVKSQQILLYKQFYSKQYKVPMENIEVQFFIVKRKIYEN